MGIRRACSYKATIQMPEAVSNYSSILVTFQQNGVNLFNLGKTDVETDGEQSIIAKLDQTQTSQFVAGTPAFLQIRAYKSQYEVPGSKVWALDVYPALNDEVLT